MRVEFAFLSCFPYQRFLKYPAKEIYSVTVSDIQAFVEKKGNVFNYMLVDSMYDRAGEVKTCTMNARTLASRTALENGSPPLALPSLSRPPSPPPSQTSKP